MNNATLTSLDLSNNSISYNGARAFLRNTTLTSLSLRDNYSDKYNISEEIKTLIYKNISKNLLQNKKRKEEEEKKKNENN